MAKLLIVDDEKAIVDVLEAVLDESGVEIYTAYDGEAALQLAIEHHPDVVLTDIRMPKMDGRQLCAQLRKHAATQSAAIVVLSAVGPGTNLRDIKPDALIHKPFDLDSVVETVESLLSARASATHRKRRS